MLYRLGTLRPGRSRTSLEHKSPGSLLPPPQAFFPIFQGLGCASGKRATSCWWQSSPAGKSSLESDFHTKPRCCGVAQTGADDHLLVLCLPHATSGQDSRAAVTLVGVTGGPSVQRAGLLASQVGVSWAPSVLWGLCLSGHTHMCLVGEWQPEQGPGTCRMAAFDLLLRPWVWPRPRSRLLREVWACVPAQGLWARRGGLGRAGQPAEPAAGQEHVGA